MSFLFFLNISIVFFAKLDILPIDVAKWMFPTQQGSWCCYTGLWTFLYGLQTGLNLGKHGINSYRDICHFIIARFVNNCNMIKTMEFDINKMCIINANGNYNGNDTETNRNTYSINGKMVLDSMCGGWCFCFSCFVLFCFLFWLVL